jgi:hypothetical protein
MGADRPARRTSRHSPGKPGAPAAARMLLAALSISIVAGAALAQTSRPTIAVTATVPAEPATQAPLAIRVGPPDAVPKGSFIRIRGLPPTIALSDGHSIAPGSWAVPIAALPNLKITLPAVAPGKSEISITLVGSDGSILAEAKSVLVVAASSPQDSRTQNKSDSPPISILRAGAPLQSSPDTPERTGSQIPPDRPDKLTPEQRERALRLVKRGDEQLTEGGIAQARLLYERAAEAGLAQGAMSMAATYDAAELGRLGVRGLQPDRAAAMRWYERARQLGAAEAEQRLRRLGAN